MRQYKEEKVEYISKCQKLGFCQDPYFVGREKVMRDIIQDLQGSSSVCKGNFNSSFLDVDIRQMSS